jgi:hypothetical protein
MQQNQPKIKLLSYLSSFIAICFIIAITFTACNKNEDAAPINESNPPAQDQTTEGFTVKETLPINESNLLVASLKKTNDIAKLDKSFGSLDWNSATITTYDKTDLSAIIVPTSTHKMLIAYFEPNIKGFKVVVLDMVPDTEKMQNTKQAGYSGEISLYLPSGDLLQSGTFENNNLITSKEMDESTLRANGLDGRCFKNCFQNTWPRLPWWMQTACGAMAGACFSGVWPMCATLAACVGGYAAACANHCWR